MTLDEQKRQASEWFRTLRDRICAEFEKIEKEFSAETSGSFIRNAWNREGGGGGEMSIIKGRVFEKAGVNISTVHGEFSDTLRKEIPGADSDPRFWASGISVVAHPCSPLVPAVHMNTRMVVIGGAAEAVHCASPPCSMEIEEKPARQWFGGGADLTPIFPDAQDTKDFHAALKRACDASDVAYYDKYKKWCDEYFFLKHRNEARGVGGIFYDYVNGGDWQKDFAFTQSVGKAFLEIYPRLVRRHMKESWTPEQRAQQLIKRGRYVEFNLLYDRGTRFGLMTGGNVEAILMSLPPEVTWP